MNRVARIIGDPDPSLSQTLVWTLMDEHGGWPTLRDTSGAAAVHPRHMKGSAQASGSGEGTGGEDGARRASSGSVARNSLVMGLGTLVSRILGLVRSPIMLGVIVGGMTTPVANSFDIANKLPNLIYMIVVGGLVNAVLVPAIVRAAEESKDGGEAFVNKLVTLAIVFLGAATLLLTLASPLIVKLFAATLSDEWFRLTVAFTFWCMPQVFFYGLYVVLGQVLNARESFGPFMWAPVLNNVVAIGGFLVILAVFGSTTKDEGADIAVWDASRVAMLGGFSTLGIVLQALVLIVPLHRLGMRFRPDFSWRGVGLGATGRTAGWVFLNQVVSIAPTMMWTNVAAGATERAETAGLELTGVAGNFAHTTAYTVYTIPQSLIVVSIATAVFTRMARRVVDGDLDAMRADVSSTIRTISTLMFLSTAGLIVLSVPISRLIAFTSAPEEAVTVARVLIAMSLGIVAVGVQTVFNRVYYAFEDTRGNFFLLLPFNILLVALYWGCLYLPPQWAVVGVGLVQSAVNIAIVFAMAWHVGPKMGGIDGRHLLAVHARLLAVVVAAMAAGGAVLRLFGPFDASISITGALVRCAVVGPVVVLAFVGAMRAMRMEEAEMVMGPVRSIGRKLGIGG